MAAIRRACARERGLTLVEMLVVLAIVGVMAGAVALSLGRNGGERGVETEARRLAGRLRLAADDVRLDERPLQFRWDRQGYGFGSWNASRRAFAADRLGSLGRHDLPGGMTLSAIDTPALSPIRPDGGGPPIVLRISARGAAWEVRFDGLDAIATQAVS